MARSDGAVDNSDGKQPNKGVRNGNAQMPYVGIGTSNGGGSLWTGGPLGGPGRPGAPLVKGQQESGNYYFGSGVPTNVVDPGQATSQESTKDTGWVGDKIKG